MSTLGSSGPVTDYLAPTLPAQVLDDGAPGRVYEVCFETGAGTLEREKVSATRCVVRGGVLSLEVRGAVPGVEGYGWRAVRVFAPGVWRHVDVEEDEEDDE